MSFYRLRINSASSALRTHLPSSIWRSKSAGTPTRLPRKSAGCARACLHGASCIKFGCIYTHPPSRPRDCPAGEQCGVAKCLLHHPKSRPIMQYKRIECRYGTRCTNTACTFVHPPGRESKDAAQPCGLSFSDLDGVSKQPHRARGASTPRFNREIVRSPMVVPTHGTRPTVGYFAATTKSCDNGAACLKYGCTYKHPESRATDCPFGQICKDPNCARLHPLDTRGLDAVAAGFRIAQNVQAKYLPTSTKWVDATVRQIRGSVLTLQFTGFEDVVAVPLRRVRHLARQAPPPRTPSPLKPNGSIATPPASPPPSPSSSLSDITELERLKMAAVAQEDYIAADQIKQRIITVKRVADLQHQKQAAVREENFLLAMQLKKQIDELEKKENATPKPAPALEAPSSAIAVK